MEHMFLVFFFIDTAPTEIYTLSLHDALPIYSATAMPRPRLAASGEPHPAFCAASSRVRRCRGPSDRKSTRLNSSHQIISYAVFCLKKKTYNHASNPLVKPNRTLDFAYSVN